MGESFFFPAITFRRLFPLQRSPTAMKTRKTFRHDVYSWLCGGENTKEGKRASSFVD
jgi:hypothetical protein